MSSALFAREALAGRSRPVLSSGVVTIVGAGAAANNICQTLALEGVGELRIVDFDTIEPSNATRSPLFPRDALATEQTSSKAETLARAAQAISYADAPVVRFTNARIESLGLGAFLGSNVIVSALDSLAGRAYLADASRLLGVPLVEIGFGFPVGHVSVYENATAEEVCWRCNRPDVPAVRASCSWYARKIVEEGKVPATQTLAAALSAIAAEAIIQALHDRFPLGRRRFHLNVETGAADVVNVQGDSDCAGVHRRHERIRPVDVSVDAPLAEVFAALRTVVDEPLVSLPGAFVREAPCALCGAPVTIDRPGRLVAKAPRCAACPSSAPSLGIIQETSTIAEGIFPAGFTLRTFGFAPGDVLEVTDRLGTNIVAVKILGELDDIYATSASAASSSTENGSLGVTTARDDACVR